MEQYLNAIVKRTVQKYLFSHIKSTKVVLGLAGTHPEEYIKILPINQRTILVDFNPVNPFIRRNSIRRIWFAASGKSFGYICRLWFL